MKLFDRILSPVVSIAHSLDQIALHLASIADGLRERRRFERQRFRMSYQSMTWHCQCWRDKDHNFASSPHGSSELQCEDCKAQRPDAYRPDPAAELQEP